MTLFSNSTFHFEIHPELGRFSFQPNSSLSPQITMAGLEITYRKNGRKYSELGIPWDIASNVSEIQATKHGWGNQTRLSIQSKHKDLGIHLIFAYSNENPFLLWKIILQNISRKPLYIEKIFLLKAGNHNQNADSPTNGSEIGSSDTPDQMAFYSNGWQSWSVSAAYNATEVQRSSRIGLFQDALVTNHGTPKIKQYGHFSSDFFGITVNRKLRTGLLTGFLSQKEQYGSIETHLSGSPEISMWANGDHTRLDPESQMQTDWAMMYPFEIDEPNPVDCYLQAVALENDVKIPTHVPSGWCSWYQFYQNLSEQKIADNLHAILQQKQYLPLDLVQIDDGFEHQVGDWFDFRPDFPDGVKPLAQKISQAGLTPGLWLAPFIVHPRSKLAKEHPEFLLKNRFNRPVNAGFIWNVFTHGLDLTVPGALEYASSVVHTAAKDWGFPYLKLDFLYAAALPAKHHDPTKTRAQILREGMQTLREAAGTDTLLLGCGAPLGSVVGLVDAMRIGPDVSGDWTPKYFGTDFIFKPEPHMPSARNAIQNILTRANLHHQWWINDPDCLLVHPETNLTLAETHSLATLISVTGGSVLVSDDLPALPVERRKIVEVLLPVIGKRAEVLDWLDQTTPQKLKLSLENSTGEWHLLTWFNRSDLPMDFLFTPDQYDLPDKEYWMRSFWDEQTLLKCQGVPLRFSNIPAHGVLLFAVRKRVADCPHYIGDNLHISQGLEITSWISSRRELVFEMELPRKAQGEIEIALPTAPVRAFQDKNAISWTAGALGKYTFNLDIPFKSRLQIQLQ